MNVQKNNNIGDKLIQVGITTNLWFMVMPFMISLAINLAFWTGNLREIKPIDFLESHLLTVPVTALTITLAQLLFRRSTAKSFAANSLTAATFLYGHMRTLVFQSSLFSRPEIASVLTWVGCCILIISLARYRAKLILQVNQILIITASLILTFNTVTIANFLFDAATPTKQKLQAIHTSNRITAPHSQKKLPSIYYVIADGYARADVLKRVYGFDNTPFLNALRERGFYICEKSLSNYPKTKFSLTSSLNSDYLASLLRINQLKQNEKSLGKLMADNKLFITAKQAGYQIVFTPSSEYTAGWFPTADIIAAPARLPFKDDLLRLTAIQPFREKIRSSYDPIQVFEANNKRKHLLNTLHFLGNSSKSKTESSRLFLCHLLAPHQPFLFDERGNSVNNDRVKEWSNYQYKEERYLKDYLGQLKFLNSKILQMVDEIQNNDPPAIIVLQSDHGPFFQFDFESVEKSDLQERFGILNAVKASDDITKQFYPTITPVNTFRIIANSIWNQSYALLEDRSYFARGNGSYETHEFMVIQPDTVE